MSDRVKILNACLHDHSGFINDRLSGFVGREQELVDISARIAKEGYGSNYISIVGRPGQGKSSIIAKLIDMYGRNEVVYHFVPHSPGPDYHIDLLRSLIAQLCLKYHFPESYVASENSLALRDYLLILLRELPGRSIKQIMFIDGLDRLDENMSDVPDISFLLNGLPVGKMVMSLRQCPMTNVLKRFAGHERYDLPDLCRTDFDLLLQQRGVRINPQVTARLYEVGEANALYLDLIARELTQPDALEPEAVIAHMAETPDYIFSPAITRLSDDLQQWQTSIKPLLGVLLVTQQPLSQQALQVLIDVPAEAVDDGLQRLGGLVQRDGHGRHILYHLRLYDFLREDTTQPQKLFVFTRDEEKGYHERLARWYDQDGQLEIIWENTLDPAEQELRTYARQHYITHLAKAHAYEQLWQVLDAGDYGTAKLRHDPSTRSYVLDLDRARDAVIAAGGGDIVAGVALLPRLWKYSLLRCSLNDRADNLPDAMFPLMVKFGREQEAIRLAESLMPKPRKMRALIQIGKNTTEPEVRAHLFNRVRNLDYSNHNHSLAALGLIEALITHGEFGPARDIANRISYTNDQIRALIMLAEGLALHEDYIAARATLVSARTHANAITREYTRVMFLINIAEAFGAQRDRDAMVDIFAHSFTVAESITNQEDRDGLFRHLTESQIKCGELAMAQATAEAIADQVKRSSLFVKLTECLASQGDFAAAHTLAEVIPDEQYRVEAWIHIAMAFGAMSDHRSVMDLLELARSMTEAMPDQDEYMSTRCGLAEAYASQGEVATARAIAESITDEEWQSIALASLVDALASRREMFMARTIAETISDPWYQFEAFISLAETFAVAGDHLSTVHSFMFARTLAEGMTDAYSQANALSDLADSQIELGECALAQATIDAIADKESQITLFVDLAEKLVEQGQISFAADVVAVVRSLSNTSGDKRQQAEVVTNFAQFLIKQDNHPATDAIVAMARSTITTLSDNRLQSELLVRLARAFAVQGEVTKAQTIIDTITDKHLQIVALAGLVQALSAQGNHIVATATLATAHAMANELPMRFSTSDVLVSLVEAFVIQGEVATARAIADTIPDKYYQVAAYTKLVQTLATQGDVTTAQAVVDSIPKDLLLDSARISLAEAFAVQGKMAEARAIVDILPYKSFDAPGSIRLVEVFVSLGELVAAHAVVDTLGSGRWQAIALIRIARILAAQGDSTAVSAALAEVRVLIDEISYEYVLAIIWAEMAQTLAAQGDQTTASVAFATARTNLEALCSKEKSGWADWPAWNEASQVFVNALAVSGETAQLLDFIQQRLCQQTTYDDLLQMVQIVHPLFMMNTDIVTSMVHSFDWVDEMLRY